MQVLVYLPHPEDLALFNELWTTGFRWFRAHSRLHHHPQLADPRYRVELVVTVFVPAKS